MKEFTEESKSRGVTVGISVKEVFIPVTCDDRKEDGSFRNVW